MMARTGTPGATATPGAAGPTAVRLGTTPGPPVRSMQHVNESTPVPAPARRVVYVVGSGRSGTSTLAGILKTLGLVVPAPEVPADDSNPRGFAEPRWVVDQHQRMLDRCSVLISDARPQAWQDSFAMAARPRPRQEVAAWLEEAFGAGDALVIKDPRLAWFLPLWHHAAESCGATAVHAIMLRHPTEVVGSKRTHYSARHGSQAGLTAAWLNMMLHTEHVTRGHGRSLVRYRDLLADWRDPVQRLGRRFELGRLVDIPADRQRSVDEFVDPTLNRTRSTWEGMDVPAGLRDLAERAWELLDSLAATTSDDPATLSGLDEVRQQFLDYYATAEAITESTAMAARREGAKAERARAARLAQAAPPGPSSADQLAGRVPHRVRALLPASARRAARRVLDRLG